MITTIKRDKEYFVHCACGVKNRLVSAIFGTCHNCKANLRFAHPFIEKTTRVNAALNYHNHGYHDYDIIDQNRSTDRIYKYEIK